MALGMSLGIEKATPSLIFPRIATPAIPNHVFLTPIDTIVPRIVEPAVLTYTQAPQGSTEKLKHSLAGLISYYREWAGRISSSNDPHKQQQYCISFKDEGVVFVEAHADHKLRDHLKRDHGALEELMPLSMSLPPPPELLHVQITRFSCGGLALGLGRHHYVTDAHGFLTFLNSWGRSTRGLPMLTKPVHDRSMLMPNIRSSPAFEHKEYPVTRFACPLPPGHELDRVHFNVTARELNDLVLQANTSSHESFTTLEALYAHLWRSVTIARGAPGNPKTVLLCPINGRKTLRVPESFVGNVVFPAATEATASQDLISKPLNYAAKIVKTSLKKTNNKKHMISAVDYVSKNLKPNTAGGRRQGASGYDPNVLITGWSSLPWYNVDFGFGRPSFAGSIGSHMEGVIRVIPGSKAGDLGVTVTLQKDHMVNLKFLLTKIAVNV